ncbi:MAG: DNA cytosine methyltransferase [Reyranella sp.]|nr:DNA cytosine methyltransferase [Reyranella sp.]
MAIRTLDLFCGGGGSSWGASSFGAEIVCGVDAWDIATLNYRDNFSGAKVVEARLDASSGREVVGRIGPIDLLLASPECTNHTCARGSRARDEESRETALFVLNFIQLFKPRWIVIENVVQMRAWPRYPELIRELERSYFIRPQILDAVNFGVPQTRRRLFIVGDREEMPSDLSGQVHVAGRSAKSILDPKGTWDARPLFKVGRAKDTIIRARRAMKALGEGVPFLIVYYGSDGAGGWQRITRPLRTLTTLDRFGLVEWTQGEPTLRMLQVPELKRAMGFPHSFKMNQGTRRDRIKLLGNGVCPPVIAALLGSLAKRREVSSSMAIAAE